MEKSLVFGLVAGVILCLASCQSKFEKVRTSGDPDLLYKEALAYYENEDYQKAQTLLELVISSFRGKKEAEEIYYKYAYTYFHQERYILAAYYFKNFSQTYSTSRLRQDTDFMAAYSNYMLSPSFRLDQTYTLQAIEGFQLYINTYPDSERVEECTALIEEMREKLERKTFEEGKLYFDLRQYQAAMHTFENLLKDFPDTENIEMVRYFIIRASFLLAENSILDKKQERYLDTVERSEEFIGRFAESRYLGEVSNILEDSLENLKDLDNVRYQEPSARAGS